jgi:hypothetical protein
MFFLFFRVVIKDGEEKLPSVVKFNGWGLIPKIPLRQVSSLWN